MEFHSHYSIDVTNLIERYNETVTNNFYSDYQRYIKDKLTILHNFDIRIKKFGLPIHK